MIIEARQTLDTRLNPAAFAGSTRWREKRKKINSTKGEAKGRTKLVSYCPECSY